MAKKIDRTKDIAQAMARINSFTDTETKTSKAKPSTKKVSKEKDTKTKTEPTVKRTTRTKKVVDEEKKEITKDKKSTNVEPKKKTAKTNKIEKETVTAKEEKTNKTKTTKSSSSQKTTKKKTATDKTEAKHRKPKEVEKQEQEVKKDTKKITKSKEVKKSNKEDKKIKQIITEQLANIDNAEVIDDRKETLKATKKHNVEIDEKEISMKIEQSKKFPVEKKRSVYNQLFINIFVAICVVVYFICIALGYKNIEETAYVTDLKVFSLSLIAIAIILFENAYNKDSSKIALFGIEIFCFAIITLISIYIFILHKDLFLIIPKITSGLVTIYYLIKIIIIYTKERKKWSKDISDVKQIISDNI